MLTRVPRVPVRIVSFAALCLLTLTAPLRAQEGDKRGGGNATPPADARGTGGPVSRGETSARIAIGERVPDFTLEDSRGRSHKLSSLRGEWIALVFAGGRESLARIDTLARLLEPDGVRVVAVCVEKPQTLARLGARETRQLLTLADGTAEVTAMFGLWDPVTRTPAPGWVLVNPEGVARVALLGGGLPNADAHDLMRYLATAAP